MTAKAEKILVRRASCDQKLKMTPKLPPLAAQTPVLGVLAAAASPVGGVPSTASNSCGTAALRAAENADGDYFFCGASGTDMAPIFKTALSQVSKGVKLMKLP